MKIVGSMSVCCSNCEGSLQIFVYSLYRIHLPLICLILSCCCHWHWYNHALLQITNGIYYTFMKLIRFKLNVILSNVSPSLFALCRAMSFCPSWYWLCTLSAIVLELDVFKLMLALPLMNSGSDVSFVVTLGMVTLAGSSIGGVSWFFVRCLYASAAADMWLNHLFQNQNIINGMLVGEK